MRLTRSISSPIRTATRSAGTLRRAAPDGQPHWPRALARGDAKWTKRGVPPGARGRSDARLSAEFPHFITDSPQDPALRLALESAEKACAGWNIGAKSPIAARRPSAA